MSGYMDSEFLLDTKTARELYHNVAESLPIIDYHCHISPAEIAQDKRFSDIAEIWLGGDHYKWRLMRAAGVEERYITGEAPNREKLQKFCEAMELAAGNPVYQWSTLELRRYFGYDGLIDGTTAQRIWDLAGEVLTRDDMSARGLIHRSNVELICTTDDPIDSLEYHREIAADPSFSTRVLPAWRPDKVLAANAQGFSKYVDRLEATSSTKIDGLDSIKEALTKRLDYFDAMGCKLSDHSMDTITFAPADESIVQGVFQRARDGQSISYEDELVWRTWVMRLLAAEYTRRGWTMQVHYGVQRNVNSTMFKQLGPDSGYDCIDTHTPSEGVVAFLNDLRSRDSLPQTILYSLNAQDNVALDSICQCFQEGPQPGKIQHGAAWWFNDSLPGMRRHLTDYASQGLLGTFVGMLTDSRSFLSYSRHEYFRRVLCGLLGEWVEKGICPNDLEMLGRVVKGVCHDNAERYFRF